MLRDIERRSIIEASAILNLSATNVETGCPILSPPSRKGWEFGIAPVNRPEWLRHLRRGPTFDELTNSFVPRDREGRRGTHNR
jgi:hypothetical protein